MRDVFRTRCQLRSRRWPWTLGFVLVLALWWLPTPAHAQLAQLTLYCDGCFGLRVALDGERMVFVNGVSAANVDGHLKVGKQATMPELLPGPHHLTVEVMQGPFDTSVYYDGPIYLRPGLDIHMRVVYGAIYDFFERPLPEPKRTFPDGGVVDAGESDAGPIWFGDGGAPDAGAVLIVRREDNAICDLILDGHSLIEVRAGRVLRTPLISPGQHQLEVKTAQGNRLSLGTLFLSESDEQVAGLHCHTGQFETYTDPKAYFVVQIVPASPPSTPSPTSTPSSSSKSTPTPNPSSAPKSSNSTPNPNPSPSPSPSSKAMDGGALVKPRTPCPLRGARWRSSPLRNHRGSG